MPVRILLADDDFRVRRSVKRLLEQEGFEIVGEAADGREAVRMAAEVCPDVAVLDLSMPDLNGVEATYELRQWCPRTPVILLTLHAEAHHVQSALSAGVQGYVVKTRAVEDLAQAIETVLQGGQFLSPGVHDGPGGTAAALVSADSARSDQSGRGTLKACFT
jgi:DNA-binding NarL/FixJ family response regulator